ncbi:MAG: hypothetical protein NUW21_11515 [Elusimicrobia bacterium]|nr:hypothetical protein [Elusimicrobiota bacterium]
MALAGAMTVSAEGPAAVMSSDSPHYRQALAGFLEAWGSSVPVVAPGRSLPPEAWAFAAIGSKAAARRWPRDAVVVACLAPSVVSDPDDAVTRVSLLPAPEALVARMRALVPNLWVLRIFWSSESSRVDTEALVWAGERQGLVVLSERVTPASRLPGYLRSLRGKADALWLMPDPALVTEENFAILREYAAAREIPLLAPTEGLAERGATATIAASYRAMGRAAALSLRARLAGRTEPEIVYPRGATVTANGPAARAVGLKLESANKVLP